MHQTSFVIDAFLQRNHSLSSVYALNVIYHKNNFFSMCGAFSTNFTENIKFPCGDMGYSDMWDFIDALKDKFCLGSILQINPNVSNKGIA